VGDARHARAGEHALNELVTRRIAGFVLRFALAYALLIVAWPLVKPLYRPVYCALGSLCFEGGVASARFEVQDTDDDLDIQIHLTKRGPPRVTGRMQNSSRLTGWMPTASLLALVLASPISWRRKRQALLWGLALLTVFVAFRMWVPIRENFSKPDALQVHHPGALGTWALGIASRALVAAPASHFVIPLLLWAVVAFRREDWELVRAADSKPPQAG
jgi:hypothetical protein